MASKIWTNTTGGAWALDSAWSPAGRPGAADDATITGVATSSQTITGGGIAASATFSGSIVLTGNYVISTLGVGSDAGSGQLTLVSGATVTTDRTKLLYGPLSVTGANTRLTVSGSLTLGGPRSSTVYGNPILAATQGGLVQAGSMVLMQNTVLVSGRTFVTGDATVSVDATSVVEVGTAGGAAAGKITVDSGRSIVGAGTLNAGGRGIVDNGVIQASGGVLTVFDPVSGLGSMQVGAGATLNLTSSAPSTVPVSLVGAGATLKTNLATTGVSNGTTLNLTGVISGFVLGDLITVVTQKVVTSATYVAGTAGAPGTLTLKGGATTIGTLFLSGDFTGKTFAVSRNTLNSDAYDVTLQQTSGTVGTPSPGTTSPDAYLWSVATGGGWNDAVNWTDTTTNANPAPIAPGLNNAVTLAGSGSGAALVIYGPGNSASLTVTGAVSLNGTFRTGALAVGTAAVQGTLNLATGTAVSATSATLLYGPLAAIGEGTKLTVTGTLSLGGPRSGTAFASPVLTVSGGAAVTAAAITLAPGTSSGAVTGGSSIVVDATSAVEVGGAGAAVPGTLTVDPGATLAGAGAVGTSAGIVDNGTVAARGGELVLTGGVRGAGVLQVGAGAALTLASGSVTTRVAFAGAAGVLTVTATSSGLNLGGTISGFYPGDTIAIVTAGPAITGVSYQPGTGLLTLTAGGTALGTLALSGDYAAYGFGVAARTGTTGVYDVTVRAVTLDPLFDPAWYLARNPDVAAVSADPYRHYMTTGWKEGRDPSAAFSTSYYESHNPDVAAAGVNPLAHFESSGWKEGRDPSAGFSVRDYLAANPDVKAAGVDPLLHYVQSGKAEGRAAFAVPDVAPDPLVDAAYYYARNPDVKAAGVDATAHYLSSGWKEGRNPDGFFDTNYYLAQNPDVKAAGVNPLLHFETNGWKEGRQPSLVFDDAKYLAANPDVRAAGIHPLQHYIQSGMAEGRAAYLTGGTAPADPLVNAAYYDAQLGATLIPGGTAGAQQAAWSYGTTGWQKGLNPDPFFDTNYYLSHNADVAAAHVDPLLHYENYGWREGRDPSPQFSTSKYLAAYSDVRTSGTNPLLHYLVTGQADGRTAFSV